MPGPRYHADPETAVENVALDGLSLIFHAPSGMTHIVAPPAPEILAALRLGPADAGELIARLSAWYDLEGDAAADAIEARLAELERRPGPPRMSTSSHQIGPVASGSVRPGPRRSTRLPASTPIIPRRRTESATSRSGSSRKGPGGNGCGPRSRSAATISCPTRRRWRSSTACSPPKWA